MKSVMEWGQLIVFTALSILCFLLKGTKEFIINSGVIIFISEMMVILFRYIVNHQAYDLLAGVDTSKRKYDFDKLNHFAEQIEFVFAFNGFIISSLIMAVSLMSNSLIGIDEKKMIVVIMTFTYAACCGIPILVLSNRKNFNVK